MIRLAAIDLKDGEVVQLVGGRPEDVRVRLSDPAGVAVRWADAGFDALHIVDLDAALGSGSNFGVIAEILQGMTQASDDRRSRIPIQVGGGVRSIEVIERLLGLGAARVIVGTKAVEDAGWRAEVTAAFPGRLVLAADTRGGVVLTRGWTASSGEPLLDFVAGRDSEPWAALLVTDVSREGQMSGIDGVLFGLVARATRHTLLAAGGIRDSADLAVLESAGVAGAVLGMSIYTTNIPLLTRTADR